MLSVGRALQIKVEPELPELVLGREGPRLSCLRGTELLKVALRTPGPFLGLKGLLPAQVPTDRPHPRLGGYWSIGFHRLFLPGPQIIEGDPFRGLPTHGLKPQLVDIQL